MDNALTSLIARSGSQARPTMAYIITSLVPAAVSGVKELRIHLAGLQLVAAAVDCYPVRMRRGVK